MKKTIGIDLGTTMTRFCRKGHGVLLREPSFVAVDAHTYKILAVGTEAKNLTGRTPGDMTSFHPLKNGVIADFDAASTMLRLLAAQSVGSLSGARVIIAFPVGTSEVEKRAVEEIVLEAGASGVALVEGPIAAALGAGLPITAPRGNMVVNLGGGITEAAVISLGSIVLSDTLRVGGNDLDEAIFSHLKYNHNILIGKMTAEELKISSVSAHPGLVKGEAEIRGRNLISGLPAVLTVSSAELTEAVSEPVEHLIELIRQTLEKTPPELAGDICESGITLTGGGALLSGFADLLNERTGVQIHVAPAATDCVIGGIGVLLENENAGGFLAFRSKQKHSFL